MNERHNGSDLTVAAVGPAGQRNYIIREATLLDAPALDTMGRHFIEQTDYGNVLRYSADSMKTLIKTILEHGTVFIAEERLQLDGLAPAMTAVGMLALCVFNHPIAGEPYADEVCWWVEPLHRRGLGPALLGAAELWARQKGVGMLKMVAPAGSAVGRYYERQGFLALETAYVKRLT